MLLLLKLFLFIGSVHSLCMPEHPQTTFCRSRFVIKGLVIESDYKVPHLVEEGDPFYQLTEEDLANTPRKQKRIELPGKRYDKDGFPIPSVIKVLVKKVFKDVTEMNITRGSIIEIELANPWDYKFNEKSEYLLTGIGFKSQNKLFSNACYWSSPWEDITYVQKWGLSKYYSLNCKCLLTFKLVSDELSLQKPDKKECHWVVWSHEIGHDKGDCQSKNGICMYFNKHDSCSLYLPKLPCVDYKNFP